jgi:hypothetical protein
MGNRPVRPLTSLERQTLEQMLSSPEGSRHFERVRHLGHVLDHVLLVGCTPSLRELRGVRSCIAYFALRKSAVGITLGRRIYLRTDYFERTPWELVAHEVAHVLQYERDGVVPFLVKYVASYLHSRLMKGLSGYEAYRAIGYEEQARAFASLASSWRRARAA